MLSHKITSSFSITDYVKELNKQRGGADFRFPIPKNKQEIEDLFEIADENILDRFIDGERKTTRISYTTYIPTHEREHFNRYLSTVLPLKLADDFSFEATGLDQRLGWGK